MIRTRHRSEYERAYFRRNSIWRVCRANWVESSSRAEAVFTGSYCFYSVRKHLKCGLYQEDFREWSRKPRLNKTWSNFKVHFDRSFKETWRSSRILKTKFYSSNVHAAQSNAALFTDMQQDHTLALANIATATQANRTSFALLTKTISNISSQFYKLTAKLATAESKNARLNKSGHCSTPDEHGHQASRNLILSDTKSNQDRNV